MSFRDIQIRVAELAGVASYDSAGLAVPPTNAYNLDRLKRAITDAVRQITNAVDPKTLRTVKWAWNYASIDVTLSADGSDARCVDGDSRRYLLPEWIASAPVNRVTWTAPNTYGGKTSVVGPEAIEREWAVSSEYKGPPYAVAVRALADRKTVGNRPRFELIVACKPDQAYTLKLRHRIGSWLLDADSDRCPWPAFLDDLLIAWAWVLLSPANQMAQLNRTEKLLAAIASNKEFTLTPIGDCDPVGLSNYVPPVQVAVNGTRVI
jgi:hypothetical protein